MLRTRATWLRGRRRTYWAAITSRLQTPCSSAPMTSARIRAVTTPTRRPVKGPGPSPTTIRSSSTTRTPRLAADPADQGGELLDVRHPVGDHGAADGPAPTGQADGDHHGGVERRGRAVDPQRGPDSGNGELPQCAELGFLSSGRRCRGAGPYGARRRGVAVAWSAGCDEATADRRMSISSRESVSPSASPVPHSTTVTAVGSGFVQPEVVQLRRHWTAGRRRRGPAAVRRSASDGCATRTKVGEITGPSLPSPVPMPWVRVVLPAPRSPAAMTRSPGRNRPASRAPSSCIARAVGTSTATGSA